METTEIEVLRNKPPGARCNTLVENLMEAAEIIDDLNSELTIEITFSKEAGTLKINGDDWWRPNHGINC